MCITPLTLARDYMTIEGSHTDIVPCGKCHECLADRRNAWAFRLKKEMEVSKSACFITLTYEEEPLSFNGNATLVKSDFQKFIKRLRKHCVKSDHKHKIKYYACGEYGTKTLRPHYHAIMFNLPHSLISSSETMAQSIWGHGIIHMAECNLATILYTAKYVMKGTWQPQQDDDDRQPEFSLMSKNLGLSYMTPQMVRHHVQKMIGTITLPGGVIIKMPRYYKNKIFSKMERRQLAKEFQEIRNLDFEKYFEKENNIPQKKDGIRRFKKIQSLQKQKL